MQGTGKYEQLVPTPPPVPSSSGTGDGEVLAPATEAKVKLNINTAKRDIAFFFINISPFHSSLCIRFIALWYYYSLYSKYCQFLKY